MGSRSFLAKYAVKDCPLEAVVITRKMYEDFETNDTSSEHTECAVDDFFDAFEAEKQDSTALMRRTRNLFAIIQFNMLMETVDRQLLWLRRREESRERKGRANWI